MQPTLSPSIGQPTTIPQDGEGRFAIRPEPASCRSSRLPSDDQRRPADLDRWWDTEDDANIDRTFINGFIGDYEWVEFAR
jgi:hypothetical protein